MIGMQCCFSAFLVLGLIVQHVRSYNILMLTPMGSKSHKIFYMGIANALIDRGHHVTILSGDANSKPIKNLTDVVIPNELLRSEILNNVFEDGGGAFKDLLLSCPEMCVKGLANKEVQELKKEKFDLVMISLFLDYCYLSLVDHMKIPHIHMFSAGLFGLLYDITGQVSMPSAVGNLLLESKFPLTFAQRLWTVVLDNVLKATVHCYIYPRMLSLCKERGLCRPDMPSFSEFDKNASLTIINEIRSLEDPPRPMMQNVIYAGGAHIKPGKPLPQDLKQWADGSGEAGFIYFSLGSAVDPSIMPERYKPIFIKVFGSLKQKVLWKWNDGNMTNLPLNVRVETWLPQPDILAHPKVRLFITHGGLLSTMEATYHAVPLLGMPLYADQFSNMNTATLHGHARVLHWKELSEESFRRIIIDIINDENIKSSSLARSILMKDRPTDPSDDAAFWVEYVIRNKGAHHLRSPVHQLSWIELNNLDVYAVLLVSVLIVFCFGYKILKLILICYCKRRITAKTNKTKNE